MSWVVWINSRKQFVQTASHCAMIGGVSPSACRLQVMKQLKLKEIDGESYRMRIDAIDFEEDARKHVVGLNTIDTSHEAGWIEIQHGAHMRLTAIEEVRS